MGSSAGADQNCHSTGKACAALTAPEHLVQLNKTRVVDPEWNNSNLNDAIESGRLCAVQNQQGGMSKGLGLHDDHQEGSFQPGSSSLDPILLDVSPELHAFESAQNGPEDGHLGELS